MTETHTSPESTSVPTLADADSHSSQLFHTTTGPHKALREVRNRLAHQSQIVLRLRRMLLSSGTSTYRVKASMVTLAHAIGISEYRAQITYTEIIATSYANGTFRTGFAERRTMGVSTGRIDRLNSLVASLKGKAILIENVARSLDKIGKTEPLYDWFLNATTSSLACAAFSFLDSGGWVECSAVAVATFFGQAIRRQMLHQRMNHFGVWTTCGGLAASVYILLVTLAQQFLGLEPTHQAGFVSMLLFLVPGFPLVTGIIDLARHGFQGGIVRLTYIFMLLVSAGVATWAVSTLFHWSVTPEYSYVLPLQLLYIFRTPISFVAAFGFAMLFNSPLKAAAVAAVIGAFANAARLLLVNKTHIQVPAAIGLAALAAGLLTTFAVSKTHFSRVALSMPIVVIMIPSMPLYRSLTYLNNGQMVKALTALFTVIFAIVDIGIRLAVARILADRNWLQEAPIAGIPTLEPPE